MEQVKDLYIISGLGADERVFYKLDFTGINVHYIKWIIPLKNETIGHYAGRILEQIPTKNPHILGLSFGGIIATEIAKLIPTGKIILVSSAKTKFELPLYFRLAGKMGIPYLLPYKYLANFKFITWFFGNLSKSDSKLILEMLKDTDSTYLNWSVNQIFNWENTTVPNNYIHIHGTNDKIILNKNIKNKTELRNGGHFMLMEKPEELNKLIINALN